MKITYDLLENEIRLIKLIGRLDIIGVGEIETKFAGYCSGDNIRVIVDMSEVEYLASIGIRLLMITAKTVVRRGGKIVIAEAIPEVQYVLEISGIPSIISTYPNIAAAQSGIIS